VKVKVFLPLLATLLMGNVFSQERIQSISNEELLEKLTPRNAPKTRSLGRNLIKDSQSTQSNPSVDLVIQFEFGSAKLLDESKPLLNKLAAVMNANGLSEYTFNIEGHTDSVGSDIYNKQLSEQRAATVINYLAAKGINKNRLTGIGKGSSSPLIVDRPDSPENRRVRIIVNS